MSDQRQDQLRLYPADELADIARRDAGDPALDGSPLPRPARCCAAAAVSDETLLIIGRRDPSGIGSFCRSAGVAAADIAIVAEGSSAQNDCTLLLDQAAKRGAAQGQRVRPGLGVCRGCEDNKWYAE